MWAGIDGSFPGVNTAAAEGLETLRAGEGGEGHDEACADWEAGIFLAAGGRPAPTAPPPFSSTLELAEVQAVDEGDPKYSHTTSSYVYACKGIQDLRLRLVAVQSDSAVGSRLLTRFKARNVGILC